MSIVEIEAAIVELPASEVDKLMSWLENYQARMWDRQIENDLDGGRMDTLLDEVNREIESGVATPL